MIVQIRHIDELHGKELGDIKPSEIKPLVSLLKQGLPVYDFSESPRSDRGFEDCRYYGSQLIKDTKGEPYVYEIIVADPNG